MEIIPHTNDNVVGFFVRRWRKYLKNTISSSASFRLTDSTITFQPQYYLHTNQSDINQFFLTKITGLFSSNALNITTIKIKMTLTDIIRIRISIHFDLALKVALPWKHLQGSPPPPSPPTSPPPSTSPSQCSNIHHHHSPWLGTKLLLHKGVCKGLQNLGSWSPKLVRPP